MIRISTFNAHHADGNHLGRLIETCWALDADVLAMQELYRHVMRARFVDQPRAIAHALGYDYAYAKATRVLFGHQCNALYVRGASRDVDVIDLPRDRGNEARVAIVARAVLPSAELTVACTHLQHRPREAAVPQLHAALDALLRRPAPRVLAGDLNLDAPHVEPILRGAGFTPIAAGPTFPRRDPHEQIDWIAVDAPWQVVRTEAPEPLVSDHRPLIVTFA